MSPSLQRLRILEICRLAVESGKFNPAPPKSFCNTFTNHVLNSLGYKGFDGLMANQIFAKMCVSPAWERCSTKDAIHYSNSGLVVVASQLGEAHGHVCVCVTGEPVFSWKWGTLVPTCANVGATEKSVFCGKGVNWAFETMPSFFVMTSDEPEAGIDL